MLKNVYFIAKIGADTAENEQLFAEILPTAELMRCVVNRCATRGVAHRSGLALVWDRESRIERNSN